MKHIPHIIFTLSAVCILCGCITSRQPRPEAATLAPLKTDMAAEQVIAWPVIPVVRLQNGQTDDLHEQFGDAEPAVRVFLQACMVDYDAYQNALKHDKKADKPDFARHFPNLLKNASIQTLSPLHKKNLDELMLMHNLCCQMNDIFFLLAEPRKTTDDLQKAIKAATSLQNLLASSPKLTIPSVMQRAADDGDVLGTEWLKLFDGMMPLSPVADEWTIATEKMEKPLPCRYGRLFPTDSAASKPTEDDLLTLSIQTKVPHDGKTPVHLVAQGLPEGFTVKLDDVALTIEAGKTSARITIPPQIITGEPQTLAISWKCNLHENARICRQLWFVMKN
ncbi:MAG: hypothetical protein IKX30_16965 [Victivallales bacterium]|nr:hypothetical protein [Victivallales bacterium]